MSGWEDVTPGQQAGHPNTNPDPSANPHSNAGYQPSAPSSSPFGGVEEVDGLVYAPQETSPELNWRPDQHAAIPAPPQRERPRPRAIQRAEPWKPGPDPVPAAARATRSRAVKMVLLSIIPIAVMAGLGYLVWTFMNAYGL